MCVCWGGGAGGAVEGEKIRLGKKKIDRMEGERRQGRELRRRIEEE